MKIYKTIALFLLMFCIVNAASAEVVIDGTRIIFNAKEQETAIQLKNKGKSPLLLQMWFDDGNPKAKPGDVKAPFIIAPPVTRIEPKAGQAVRVLSNKPNLPSDRESVYWFNLLEIPPQVQRKQNNNHNLIQLAFRTRVKFFYRPDGLKMKPAEAYRKLNFRLNNTKLNVKNQSPYFITFKSISIGKGKNIKPLGVVEKFNDRMIPPFGEITYDLKTTSKLISKGNKVIYSVINDYGGETTNEQDVK
ncbi:fimbrial biogenesis chaperone [Enterobacter hormaechei]|uniref:fimbrial biogenesis chaperone n=1 Tax=Enterobacter hormaechei TaxID=158836 RepID=UPI0021759F63|nr:fimbria/pilus periplasmic chaperone [Enterobacter hormaechei]UVZ93287.1 fimbria/pilus periplasmic chaperone [Enterobacter hormaechei]